MRVIHSLIVAGAMCSLSDASISSRNIIDVDSTENIESDECSHVVNAVITHFNTDMETLTAGLRHSLNEKVNSFPDKDFVGVMETFLNSVGKILIDNQLARWLRDKCRSEEAKLAETDIQNQAHERLNEYIKIFMADVKHVRVEWLIAAVAGTISATPFEIMTNMQSALTTFDDPRFNMDTYADIVQRAVETDEGKDLVRRLRKVLDDDLKNALAYCIRNNVSTARSKNELTDAARKTKSILENMGRDWYRRVYGKLGTAGISSIESDLDEAYRAYSKKF